MTTIREAIAIAASAVPGVTVTPFYTQDTAAGHGFVSYRGAERDSSGLGFMVTWRVTVCLAKTTKDAEKWLETHTTALIDAIETHLIVTTTTPARLDNGQGTTVPCLLIEGVRAQE